MDDLVKLVAERAGLSADVARKAVDAVLSGLKAKLPAPVAAQLDAALSGGGGDALGTVARGLGGLFGK